MQTFKAQEGYLDVEDMAFDAGKWGAVSVEQAKVDGYHIPCTVIPGHWADRLESGKLLDSGEWNEARKEYEDVRPPCEFVEYLVAYIARKLRGGK